MRILCPLCGFGRDLDISKIPPRAQMATCPKCAHKFRFRVVDDLEPLPGPAANPVPDGAPASSASASSASTSSASPGAAQPDPMAAQRAAAEQAWKRIQGVKDEDKPAAGSALANAPQELEATRSGQEAGTTSPSEPEARLNATASGGQPSPVPFEDLPNNGGFFGGLWSTIFQALKTPSAFFRSMPTTGGMARPLVFHLLLAEFMVFCQFLWGLSGLGSFSQYAGSPELMDMGMSMAGAGSLMLLIFYPLLLILRLLVMTAIIHLLLKLLRSGQGGAEGTFRVLCYAAAPLVIGILPLVGPIIGGVWSIGLTILGLREAHRTSFATAMFAVLLPILLLLAAVLGMVQGGMMHAG